ncbi:MAG: hypothetical protein HY535_05855 [Chloroflexi bacterium]|nr:hypothetical protein [Chloroflexota bacterium]
MVTQVAFWRRGTAKRDQLLRQKLQQALQLVLRCAVYYPRVADYLRERAPDPFLDERLLKWGAMMVHASDAVASVITRLGAEPRWSVDCAPDELNPPHYFRTELARLLKATSLLREAAEAARSDALRQELLHLAEGKQRHFEELRGIQNEFLKQPSTTS